MKKLPILILTLFLSSGIIAQSDIIYPISLNYNIRHCKITDIKNNIVHYQKNDLSDSVEAVAVRQNKSIVILTYSDSVRLYKNHDYNYYSKLYKKELTQQYIGYGITGLGLGLFATSILTFNHCNTTNDCGEMSPIPYLIGLGGVISTGVGIIILTGSSIKKKEYKRGMEYTDPKIKLAFKTNNQGVGLVLNF
jgi:hypothetical protein